MSTERIDPSTIPCTKRVRVPEGTEGAEYVPATRNPHLPAREAFWIKACGKPSEIAPRGDGHQSGYCGEHRGSYEGLISRMAQAGRL